MVAEGVLELLGANLERYGDMATTDLRTRAPVDESSVGDSVGEDVGTTNEGNSTAGFWRSCALDGPVMPVDLRTGSMIPMQVTVAGRGRRAVALVTLGHSPGGRHGMAFTASRWVEWTDGEPSVFETTGFGSAPTVVLEAHGGTVLSVLPASDDQTPEDGPFSVVFNRVNAHGRVLTGPVRLNGTDGFDIDSQPVEWSGGTAVVLGHDGEPPRQRQESLWFLDSHGRTVRSPLNLTTESRDLGFGAPCAGLSVSPNGASLTAAWTVADGPRAGVWVRRGITLAGRDSQGRARDRSVTERWLQGSGWWSPTVGPLGVLVRRNARSEGSFGALAEVVLSHGRDRSPSLVATLWDPLAVWSSGGAIITGTEPGPSEDSPPRPWLATVDGRTRRTTTVPFASDRTGGIREAVDIAMAAVDNGAVVAWIETLDPGRRRLAMARLGCQPR